MTSVYNLETKLKGFQLGAVDYITKPFEAQEILATIKTQLSLKQREQVLQQQNICLPNYIQRRSPAD